MAYLLFDKQKNKAVALYHGGEPPRAVYPKIVFWCPDDADINDNEHWSQVAAAPEQQNPPEGYDEELYSIAWTDDGWQTGRRIDSPVVRDVMIHKVNAKRNEKLAAGQQFSFNSQVYTLQTRDAEDLLNWIGLANKATQLPADTSITIRTAENQTITMNAGQIATLVGQAIAKREQTLAASWSLKDSIRDAVSNDEAYDTYEAGIETCWPEDTPITVT